MSELEQIYCQREGCSNVAAVECLNPGSEDYDEWIEHLCVKHAIEEGFCYCCGDFWAGVDARIKGICPNCLDEFDDEWEEDEDSGSDALDDGVLPFELYHSTDVESGDEW